MQIHFMNRSMRSLDEGMETSRSLNFGLARWGEKRTRKRKGCFHSSHDESEFEKLTWVVRVVITQQAGSKIVLKGHPKKGSFLGSFWGSQKGSKNGLFWGPSNTLTLCWSHEICCAWTNFMMQTHQAWRVAAQTSKNVKKPVLGRFLGAWYFIRPWKTSKNDVFGASKIVVTTC